MVLTSPFSSIKAFIVSKPPLVLFTLCLVGFGITTFTFAYYVEHNKNMPNLDADRDLLSFLKHLSKRRLCISSNEVPITHTTIINGKNAEFIDNLTSIYVKGKLQTKNFINNMTHYEGYVPMSDWVSVCTLPPLEKVKISFSLPEAINLNDAEINVCVKIDGPVSVLAPAINSKQCMKPNSPHTKTLVGHIYKAITDKSETCDDDKINNLQEMQLTYEPGVYEGLLLSTHDRSIINLHLFHTSYFLLVMAITLICYAMIKGKPVPKHQQSMDKIPLDV